MCEFSPYRGETYRYAVHLDLIAMQCTNDLLISRQQYMFNVCSIAGTVVTDLFYIVYCYYLINYMFKEKSQCT